MSAAHYVSWADAWQAYGSVTSAAAAFIAALLVASSVSKASSSIQAQNRSSDIASVLAVWERLDDHWRKYKTAKLTNNQFELGQLLSYYEVCCSLFYNDAFSTNASKVLHEHLYEILPLLKSDPEIGKIFSALISNNTTFDYINWFCQQPPPEKLIIISKRGGSF